MKPTRICFTFFMFLATFLSLTHPGNSENGPAASPSATPALLQEWGPCDNDMNPLCIICDSDVQYWYSEDCYFSMICKEETWIQGRECNEVRVCTGCLWSPDWWFCTDGCIEK
jgi:hypothetical protein